MSMLKTDLILFIFSATSNRSLKFHIRRRHSSNTTAGLNSPTLRRRERSAESTQTPTTNVKKTINSAKKKVEGVKAERPQVYKRVPWIVLRDVLKSGEVTEVRKGTYKLAKAASRGQQTPKRVTFSPSVERTNSMDKKMAFMNRLGLGNPVVRVKSMSQEEMMKFMSPPPKPRTRRPAQKPKYGRGRQWGKSRSRPQEKADEALAAELILRVQRESHQETNMKISQATTSTTPNGSTTRTKSSADFHQSSSSKLDASLTKTFSSTAGEDDDKSEVKVKRDCHTPAPLRSVPKIVVKKIRPEDKKVSMMKKENVVDAGVEVKAPLKTDDDDDVVEVLEPMHDVKPKRERSDSITIIDEIPAKTSKVDWKETVTSVTEMDVITIRKSTVKVSTQRSGTKVTKKNSHEEDAEESEKKPYIKQSDSRKSVSDPSVMQEVFMKIADRLKGEIPTAEGMTAKRAVSPEPSTACLLCPFDSGVEADLDEHIQLEHQG